MDEKARDGGVVDEDYRNFHRSRCRNETMYGARFGDAESLHRIDVVFYPDCQAMDFFWFDGGEVQNWNATFVGDTTALMNELFVDVQGF